MDTEENSLQEDYAKPQKDYFYQKMVKQIKDFKEEHTVFYFTIFMALLAAEVAINAAISYFILKVWVNMRDDEIRDFKANEIEEDERVFQMTHLKKYLIFSTAITLAFFPQAAYLCVLLTRFIYHNLLVGCFCRKVKKQYYLDWKCFRRVCDPEMNERWCGSKKSIQNQSLCLACCTAFCSLTLFTWVNVDEEDNDDDRGWCK